MRLIFLILFFSISTRIFAPADNSLIITIPVEINRWLNLWQATCFVESEGNPLKINMLEGAYGIVQIRQCKLDDYNKATSENYLLPSVINESVSREIFLQHCSTCNSDEEASRTWNGGPRGMDKPQTKIYWEKIKVILGKRNSHYL
jgi:hypothetical protein